MLKPKTTLLSHKSCRGDTIVEVLIAIAVAAFAIGTAYAIANKSLQRAITARERNQALNLIQNQISDLKTRYKFVYKSNDPGPFNQDFAAETAPPPYPSSGRHFCLNDNADPSNIAAWGPQDNTINTASDYTIPTNYAGACRKLPPQYDTEFDVDINAEITPSSAGAKTKTVYEVSVHWVAIGGANTQATIFYRF